MEAHAATVPTAPRSPWKGVRSAAVLLGLGIGAYFVVRQVPGYLILNPDTYPTAPYFWPRVQWIFPHVLAGLFAITIGPLQLWSRIRDRYRTFHRVAGRVYLGAIVVGSFAAFGLSVTAGFTPAYRVGLFSLGIVWLSTTGMAFAAIRRRKIQQHRQWMIRSYVVTFAFVFFRVFQDIAVAAGIATFDETQTVMAWACWALPLLVTEMVLQGKEIFARAEVSP